MNYDLLAGLILGVSFLWAFTLFLVFVFLTTTFKEGWKKGEGKIAIGLGIYTTAMLYLSIRATLGIIEKM